MIKHLFCLTTACFLFAFPAIGQNANLIVINNHPLFAGDSMDIQIYDQNADTLIVRVDGVPYQGASPSLSLPASLILKYRFRMTSDQSLFSAINNQVLTANTNSFAHSYGTPALERLAITSLPTNAGSNARIRFIFTQSVEGLQAIDLLHRENDVLLGDDMVFGESTFAGATRFDVVAGIDTAILDVVDRHNHNLGLFAYQFDQNYFAGKSIFLFTSGSSNDLRLFAVELDGTVTEFTWTDPVLNTSISPELSANVSIYPNPVKDKLLIDFEEREARIKLSLFDPTGKQFKQENFIQRQSVQVDLNELPMGLYMLKIETDKGYFVRMVQKE